MADNKLNKKYTLEEHLRFLSIEDKDYEILYSIWYLNKKNLTQGLSLISSSFPHYSIHCSRHTFATTVTLANDVALQNVSKMLGHSSTRMTQHYARVLDNSIMKDMQDVSRVFG